MPQISSLLAEGSEQIVKSHLRKIVEIYDSEWIIAHELIQNAIDAVQANPRVERGVVDISFDLDTDTVTVRDNGTGFKKDLNLLQPGGTGEEKRLKSRSPAKGYQGVGLKAVMYSTDFFQITSQLLHERWTFTTRQLREYLDPDVNVDPTYDMSAIDEQTEDTYTSVEARFPTNSLAKFLSGLNRLLGADMVAWQALYAQEKEDNSQEPYEAYVRHILNWYFRTQSYIGCVNSLLNIPVTNPDTGEPEPMKPVEIQLHLKSVDRFNSVTGQMGEWLQSLAETEIAFAMPYQGWDFAEVITDFGRLKSQYQVAPQLIQIKPDDEYWEALSATFQDKFLDLKLKPNEQEDDFRKRYADFISILEKPRSAARAEEFQDLFPKIRGIYLAIGRTSHFEILGVPNHGLRFIASNGTPTEHEIIVRSTSSTWYLETIHFIVNVDATLNIGKRHLVDNRLVGRVRDFFEACYPKLVSISKLFVKRDPRGGGDEVDLPQVIDLKTIARQDIAVRRFPDDENTLIALFSAAIAKLDPEFSIYGLFSHAVYDGKFRWTKEEPRSELELKPLEFKRDVNILVDEFEKSLHDKEFSDVALAIVWDRRVNKPGWNVKGISPARRTALENRGVPTNIVKHVLEDRHGNYCALVSVADLLIQFPVIKGHTDNLEEFVNSMG